MIIILSTISTGVMIGSSIVSAIARPRTDIYVFKYTVPANYEGDFANFYSIIHDKLLNLGEHEDLDDEALAIIKSINLKKVTDDQDNWLKNEMSNNEMEQYWLNTGALQLFDGRVSIQNNIARASTRVYLGRLTHDLGGDAFRIDLDIIDTEYDTTQDSHSAIILYALTLAQVGLIDGATALDCSKAKTGRALFRLAFESSANAADRDRRLEPIMRAIRTFGDRLGTECPP